MVENSSNFLEKLPSEVVVFLEGLDIAEHAARLDQQFSKMKEVLKSGTSQLLLHPKSSGYPGGGFAHFLGFENSFSEDKLSKVLPKTDSARLFQESEEGGAGKKAGDQDDDEVVEVKYPEKPQKIKDVTGMQIAVHTNAAEVAQLCEVAEINYFYSDKSLTGIEQFLGEVQGFSQVKGLDMVVLYHKISGDLEKDAFMQAIEQLCDKAFGKIFLKVICGPFGADKFTQKDLINFGVSGSDNKGSSMGLEAIIPRQTYQFNRAEINPAFQTKDFQFSLCFSANTEKKGWRTDKIESFEMLGNKDNLRKLGGGRINISGLFREITFELGKLPKFGA